MGHLRTKIVMLYIYAKRERKSIEKTKTSSFRMRFFTGASDEARTRYLHLGKVALYQMSYTRSDKREYTKKLSSCQEVFLKKLNFFIEGLFRYCAGVIHAGGMELGGPGKAQVG